jgi:hypothetical protein
MAHRSIGTKARASLTGVVAAAGIAACGGEVVALLAIVTPLGGSWSDGGNESIFFSAPAETEQVFASNIAVTASVTSSKGVCGSNGGAQVAGIPGTLNNGQLTLTLLGATAPCLEGSFTDLRRLEVSAPGLPAQIVYLNDRVAVNLQAGLWRGPNGAPTLKFTAPSSVDNGATAAVAGCDVSNSAAKVNFTGTLNGFNTATLAKPSIPALAGTAFTQVEFFDGATLKLLNGGQGLTLTRQADPSGTTC